MKKRSVKYGILLSLVTGFALLLKLKSITPSNQEKKRALTPYSQSSDETLKAESRQPSKDMYDHIGHTFTSMITCLDALPFLIKNNPQEAELNIKEMSTIARKGLDEVRKTIHS